MNVVRRLSIIFAAYLCASLTAALAIFLSLAAFGGSDLNSVFGELRLFPVVVWVVGVFAAPAALPVIVVHEMKGTGAWQWFAGVGVVLGIAMSALFLEDFESGDGLAWAISLMISAVSGAMTYWLVAWRIFQPSIESSSFSRV